MMEFVTSYATCVLSNFLAVIPQRVALSVLGFLAIANAYTMRLCLDVALSQIVQWNAGKHTPSVGSRFGLADPQAVRLRNITRKWSKLGSWNLSRPLFEARRLKLIGGVMRKSDEPLDVVYNWSPALQTSIQTSFYFGYLIGHVPGALLVNQYGSKKVLFLATLIAGILTLATPAVIRVGGPAALIFVRFLIGMSEGPMLPALCGLLSQWVPTAERGKWCVLVLSAGQVGVFVVNVVSTLLLKYFRWPVLFYVFGTCALLWIAAFVFLAADDPDCSSYICDKEKCYLQRKMRHVKRKQQLPATPWKDILHSVPTWALISASIQHEWTQSWTRTAMQERLRAARELPLSESLESTLRSLLPNLLNWLVSLLSGCLSDLLVARQICSVTRARQIMTTIAAVSPNFFSSFSSCFSCAPEGSGLGSIVSCTISSLGTYYSGIRLSALDLSPNYSSSLMAIANTFGSLSSILAPYMPLESFFKSSPMLRLRAIFWLICTIYTSGEVQAYNDPGGTGPIKMD